MFLIDEVKNDEDILAIDTLIFAGYKKCKASIVCLNCLRLGVNMNRIKSS